MSVESTGSAIQQALHLYRDQPLGIQAFVRARHLLCPLPAIERHVPRKGRIVDLGCGHGLFSALMAIASPERSILGIDPSPAKIQIAGQLAGKLPNVQFLQATAGDLQEGNLEAITILDVLYLLPPEKKREILLRCHELLAPGGLLVLKTNDTHPAWKYRWAWLQEVGMTRVGLTMNHGSLHFFSCGQTLGMLREVGFGEVQVMHIPFAMPYPHTLFLCSR